MNLAPKRIRTGKAKLTPDQVLEMRALRATGITLRELSEKYGVAIPTVYDATTKHRNWKSLH